MELPRWARGHDAPLNYHRIMIDDAARMDAYERAIRKLVKPGDVVLDTGTGTGVLAMLAARAGAARVHAVESMPIARLARRLVEHNGLEKIVTVHEADLCTLDPVEPVDLIIGDFMGRFVIDDGMMPAIAAAGHWLKPTGRFAPSRIELYLSPVGDMRIEALDALVPSVYGIDLSPAVEVAMNCTYHSDIDPDWLLGPKVPVATIVPPIFPVIDRDVTVKIDREGDLRGLAGYFVAELAPGVKLSTAPGRATHWGQLLFPIPSTNVHVGDELTFHFTQLEGSIEWRWSGPGFTHESEQRLGDRDFPIAPATPPADRRQAVLDANDRGARAFGGNDLGGAVRAWEEAARLLDETTTDLTDGIYENLGLAWYNLGRDGAATRAFLRALDGKDDLEQSLRFLIDLHERNGHPTEAERVRQRHERHRR
jgi:SAM-dependent methyltransferase